jgi:hypothetical protein
VADYQGNLQNEQQTHRQTRGIVNGLQQQTANLQNQLDNANNAIGGLNTQIADLTNERDARPTQQQLDRERETRAASHERNKAQINNLQQENRRLQLINQGLTGGLERHLDNELTAYIIQNVNNNPPFYGRRG